MIIDKIINSENSKVNKKSFTSYFIDSYLPAFSSKSLENSKEFVSNRMNYFDENIKPPIKEKFPNLLNKVDVIEKKPYRGLTYAEEELNKINNTPEKPIINISNDIFKEYNNNLNNNSFRDTNINNNISEKDIEKKYGKIEGTKQEKIEEQIKEKEKLNDLSIIDKEENASKNIDLENLDNLKLFFKKNNLGEIKGNDLSIENKKQIQKFLSDKNYDIGQEKFKNKGVDGIIGDVTKNAIKEFNENNSDKLYIEKESEYKDKLNKICNIDEEHCAEYVINKASEIAKLPRAKAMNDLGITGNAWDMEDNLISKGNVSIFSKKYYPKKDRLNNIKRGDVVNIYTGGSSFYQSEANKKKGRSDTPTHVGIVDSEILKDEKGRDFFYVLDNYHSITVTGYQGRLYRRKAYIDVMDIPGVGSIDAITSVNYDKINKTNINKTLDIVPKKTLTKTQSIYVNKINDDKFIDKITEGRDINTGEYWSLAKIALGLLEQESGTVDEKFLSIKEAGANISKIFSKNDETSRGYSQLKFDTNFNVNDKKDLKRKFDITESDLSQFGTSNQKSIKENSLTVSLYKLIKDYESLKNKNKLLSKEKKLSEKEMMYQVTALYNRGSYTRKYGKDKKNIKEYSKDNDISYVNKVLRLADKNYKLKDKKGREFRTMNYIDYAIANFK